MDFDGVTDAVIEAEYVTLTLLEQDNDGVRDLLLLGVPEIDAVGVRDTELVAEVLDDLGADRDNDTDGVTEAVADRVFEGVVLMVCVADRVREGELVLDSVILFVGDAEGDGVMLALDDKDLDDVMEAEPDKDAVRDFEAEEVRLLEGDRDGVMEGNATAAGVSTIPPKTPDTPREQPESRPQHIAPPLDRMAHVWDAKAWIAVTPDDRPETATGANWFVVVPSPKLP